jgi:predicted permease
VEPAPTVINFPAPAFLLAAVGFAGVRLGYEYRVAFVTQLAMTLSVPCLIFAALLNTNLETVALAEVSLASLVAAVIAGPDRRTPVAVTSCLLAEKYGADAQPVAGLVLASTLLSVVTLPLILLFVM